MAYQIDRRDFLKTVSIATAGVTIGVGSVDAAHTDEPTISFPDGTALVLENTQGPLEAAVRTRNVHMPDGGWVVISTDQQATQIVGRSAQRLPAGHYENLLVSTKALESGTYTLYATLFKGDKRDTFPGDGAAPYDVTQDAAEIQFP